MKFAALLMAAALLAPGAEAAVKTRRSSTPRREGRPPKAPKMRARKAPKLKPPRPAKTRKAPKRTVTRAKRSRVKTI